MNIVRDLAYANGGPMATVLTRGSDPTLPGFFRATKKWDIVVTSGDRLIAAIELKSQVGPSFGNNLNNRVEEAIGNAVDLLNAHREGAFGAFGRPFIGYMFVLEDCDGTERPIRSAAEYPLLPEFHDASYAQRYEILCRKLMLEQLYDAACLVLTPRAGRSTGSWRSRSEETSLGYFARMFAGRIAAEADG